MGPDAKYFLYDLMSALRRRPVIFGGLSVQSSKDLEFASKCVLPSQLNVILLCLK
jgi:hypothetical protein